MRGRFTDHYVDPDDLHAAYTALDGRDSSSMQSNCDDENEFWDEHGEVVKPCADENEQNVNDWRQYFD